MRHTLSLLVLTLLLSSCGMNMYDQPKAELYEASPFFADGMSARPIIEGTVSRDRGAISPSFFTGLDASGLMTDVPIELTFEVLARGQERYNIYCSPCHNYNGDGLGVIVQKGMVQPASFHEQRLRESPVGYFFNAMTNGFGRMYSYASRIPPEDRWAITAYIKALQLSQYASADDMPADLLEQATLTAEERP
jgi:mono/diheme cytochrome c family protein